MTHEVTDIYLDDILPMINYKPAARGSPHEDWRAAEGTELGQSQQQQDVAISQAFDEAISRAFLQGTDQDFTRLLEVSHLSRRWHCVSLYQPTTAKLVIRK